MKREPILFPVPEIASIQDMVFHSARTYGDKIALEDLKDYPIPRLTFNSLLKNIAKFGMALRALGLKERSHIAVIGENRVQWSLAYLTAMCFDQVVVPIDKNLTLTNEDNFDQLRDVQRLARDAYLSDGEMATAFGPIRSMNARRRFA